MPIRPNSVEDLIVLAESGAIIIPDTVSNFSVKSVYVPLWSEIAREYYPELHDIILNKRLRPLDTPCEGGMIDRAARITYPAEKRTVREFVQMGFTNPVIRTYDTAGDDGQPDPVKEAQSDAIEAVYKEMRINGINNNRATAWSAACEFATIYYAQPSEQHTDYGVPVNVRIRSRSYSPMPERDSHITEAQIYPTFDRYDNLIALGIKYDYTVMTDDLSSDTTTYFELYTASKRYSWSCNSGLWKEEEPERDVPIGKIPGVYCRRSEPIWSGIETFRNEIEFTLSRESDSLRKNNKPIIVLSGTLVDPLSKPTGDYAREFYNVVGDGAGIELIAPPVTYEASRSYTNEQKENIREVTQMTDLTAKSISGSGLVSGTARETLLINPSLRVLQETQEYLVALDREFNIIKSLLGEAYIEWQESIKSLKAEHSLDLYKFKERSQLIIDCVNAVAGGFMSKKTAIGLINEAGDVEMEWEQILQEAREQANLQAEADRLV